MSAANSNTSLPEKKSGYTFAQNETLFLITLYQKYEENCSDNGFNGSLFVGRHICYAMFTRPGPTGFFLCRQSELFLAFRTNHSYSRIVDKKTRPKSFVLLLKTLQSKNVVFHDCSNFISMQCFSRMLIFSIHKSIIVKNSLDTRFSRSVFEAVQKTHSTCFIASKTTRLRLVVLNLITHSCSSFKHYIIEHLCDIRTCS